MGKRRRVVSRGSSPWPWFAVLLLGGAIFSWLAMTASRPAPVHGPPTLLHETVAPRPAGRPPAAPQKASPPTTARSTVQRPAVVGVQAPTVTVPSRPVDRRAPQETLQTPSPPSTAQRTSSPPPPLPMSSPSPTNAASDPRAPAAGYEGVSGYGRPAKSPTAPAPRGYNDLPSTGGAPSGY